MDKSVGGARRAWRPRLRRLVPNRDGDALPLVGGSFRQTVRLHGLRRGRVSGVLRRRAARGRSRWRRPPARSGRPRHRAVPGTCAGPRRTRVPLPRESCWSSISICWRARPSSVARRSRTSQRDWRRPDAPRLVTSLTAQRLEISTSAPGTRSRRRSATGRTGFPRGRGGRSPELRSPGPAPRSRGGSPASG